MEFHSVGHQTWWPMRLQTWCSANVGGLPSNFSSTFRQRVSLQITGSALYDCKYNLINNTKLIKVPKKHIITFCILKKCVHTTLGIRQMNNSTFTVSIIAVFKNRSNIQCAPIRQKDLNLCKKEFYSEPKTFFTQKQQYWY